MPVYQYRAQDKNRNTVNGLVEAPTEEAAVDLLKDKNLKALYVEEVKQSRLNRLPFLNAIKVKDVVIFSRQFAVLISANVAMVQSLKIVSDQTENPRLRLVISDVTDDVDAGTRLSEAMAKHPKVFSNFYVSVIRSGETSGKLEEVLSYLADEMEKDYDMMSKIKGAMIYPAFVMVSLITVGIVMMIFVVPKLTSILTETGQELPMATKALIWLSAFLTKYWWTLAFAAGALWFGYKSYGKTTQGRHNLDKLALHIPVFGTLLRRIYLVRFTRSMHTLIAGGVTITKSLKIAADVVGNSVYKQLIEETVKEVEDGNSISAVFMQSKEVPKMVGQMMSVGEKTGKLEIVLEKVTDFYGREVSNIVANLMTLMEPLIMVVMGMAVAGMVMAIIVPIYNMSSGV
ncbi:type II secretion system F family protein [Candidatus Falkowbacteria bacterium]|nr:type II secretion system F family protein [Candidatus Falkowbacteria bacterium]